MMKLSQSLLLFAAVIVFATCAQRTHNDCPSSTFKLPPPPYTWFALAFVPLVTVYIRSARTRKLVFLHDLDNNPKEQLRKILDAYPNEIRFNWETGNLWLASHIQLCVVGDICDFRPQKDEGLQDLEWYTAVQRQLTIHPNICVVVGNRDGNKLRLLHDIDKLLELFRSSSLTGDFITMKGLNVQASAFIGWLQEHHITDPTPKDALQFVFTKTMGCSDKLADLWFQFAYKRNHSISTNAVYDKLDKAQLQTLWQDLKVFWFGTNGLFLALLRKMDMVYYEDNVLMVHGCTEHIRTINGRYEVMDSGAFQWNEQDYDGDSLPELVSIHNTHYHTLLDNLFTGNVLGELTPNQIAHIASFARMGCDGLTTKNNIPNKTVIYNSAQRNGKTDIDKLNQLRSVTTGLLKKNSVRAVVHGHQPVGETPACVRFNGIPFWYIDTSQSRMKERKYQFYFDLSTKKMVLNYPDFHNGQTLVSPKDDKELPRRYVGVATVNGVYCDVYREYIGELVYPDGNTLSVWKRGKCGVLDVRKFQQFAQVYELETPNGFDIIRG